MKIPVKEFTCSKVGGYKSATLLTMNSFTGIFQRFCLYLVQLVITLKFAGNTYFLNTF